MIAPVRRPIPASLSTAAPAARKGLTSKPARQDELHLVGSGGQSGEQILPAGVGNSSLP